MTFIVGLTGGIGSGKSTVANLFVERGVALVDTDVIAHDLTGPEGAAMGEVARVFGRRVLRADGALDRVAMRRLVFADPSAKRRLEALLHPLIRAESERRCAAAANARYVILAVPLLVETGNYRQQVDRVLVVDCAERVQIARVMARSGLAATEVEVIMASQVTRAERRAAADDLICNDTDLAALAKQVEALHQQYSTLAGAKLAAALHSGR